MHVARSTLVLIGVLGVGACAATPPAGPSVMVLPGDGKSFAQFQQDDATCRATANSQIVAPGTNSTVAGAAIGTIAGAAAGAAIGAAAGNAGAGAAIGAGTGLVGGTAIGASNAEASSYGMQRHYDITYTQCMVASGNKVPPAPVASAYPAYPGYPAYPYPYYYGPTVYGPSVVIGGGWRRHYW
jgi:hypothetical protein